MFRKIYKIHSGVNLLDAYVALITNETGGDPCSQARHLFKRPLNRFNRSPLTDFGLAKGPCWIKGRSFSSSYVRFVTVVNDVAKTTGGTRENVAGQGD